MMDETFPIEVMPPTSTIIATIIITRPVIYVGTLNVLCMESEMEFACVIFPIPKDASTAKRANRNANKRPAHLILNPFFIVYIGPPLISPLLFFSRYLIESVHSLYFVASPNKAQIHIHTSAPGPPITIAVATPTMLPVPIVAASAVVSAENGEISPELPCEPDVDLFLNTDLNA